MWLRTRLSKIGCDDVVGPEGMEKFCEDIGVEPENVSRFSFAFLVIWCSLVTRVCCQFARLSPVFLSLAASQSHFDTFFG